MKVKMKTNRTMAKRFKITANGHIKRAKANGSHYNTRKPKDRKRRLRKKTLITNPKVERKLKPLLQNI